MKLFSAVVKELWGRLSLITRVVMVGVLVLGGVLLFRPRAHVEADSSTPQTPTLSSEASWQIEGAQRCMALLVRTLANLSIGA